jgi:nucleoside-diphosphate-sugar epimerase
MSEAPAAARMEILVTGATGYIGNGVAGALVRRGHKVTGTTRTAGEAQTLSDLGVEPVPVELRDAAQLAELASRVSRRADITVHCAFASPEEGGMQQAISLEQEVTAALVRAVTAGGRALVYTSGVGVLAGSDGEVAPEDFVPPPQAPMRWRYDLERLVAHAGGRVVRPALVYGHGGNAIIRDLIRQSAVRGASGYLGDGDGTLPTVYLDDLVDGYVRVIEKGARGQTYTFVGDTTSARAVMEEVGRLVGASKPAKSLDPETIATELPAAQWIAGDVPVAASRAREELAWTAFGPTLIDELAHGEYSRLASAEAPR